MGLGEMVRNWLFNRAAKKAAVTVAQAAAAYALAHNGTFNSWGASISLDPDAVAAALLAASEVGRNWLKFRFPKIFSWM